MSLTKEDILMLETEANVIFNSLPLTSYFYFMWYKASIKPDGITWPTLVWETVPGLRLPAVNNITEQTPEGELVVEEEIKIAIPKRWGETVFVETTNVTYVGGIQVHDKIKTQDGLDYRVMSKESRGLGAYYLLRLRRRVGYDESYITAQYSH